MIRRANAAGGRAESRRPRPISLPRRLDLRTAGADTSRTADLPRSGARRLKRLAGRIILLWGWRRALAAFLAGAVAVLAQAPFDFFAACFVSFPVLVWLLDGAPANADAPLSARGLAGVCGRLVVRLRLFRRRPVVGRRRLLVEAEGFAWAMPLAVTALAGILGAVLWRGLRCGAAVLDLRHRPHRRARGAFAAAEWLRGFLFTGFPVEPGRLRRMPMPLLMQIGRPPSA